MLVPLSVAIQLEGNAVVCSSQTVGFLHVARGVWLCEFSAQNLIMVSATAYFDDSGADAGNESLVIAGFVADVDQWDRFSCEWDSALKDHDIDFFKAKEFDDGRRGFGRYADWPAERRKEFMGRLLGIITRRVNRSIATTLKKSDYEALIRPRLVLSTYFGSPYAFCCYNVVLQVRKWRDSYYNDVPVLYIFDDGHANAGEIKSAREAMKKGDKLMIDIDTKDDENIPPLQAADLLAFGICSETRRQLNGSARDTRYPLQRLDDHVRDWVTIGQKEIFEEVARRQMIISDLSRHP